MKDIIAEQTTGIKERVAGGGLFYDDAGNAISDATARRLIRQGEAVESPNAGAGSYREIARRLGFKRVYVEDWTSSAGDWCFNIQGGRLLCQSNRYPYYGFRYSIARKEEWM